MSKRKQLDLDAEDLETVLQRETVKRRQSTYSAEALRVAEDVDKVYVLHTDFIKGLRACDRAFQLAGRLSVPFGVRVMGVRGTGKTSIAEYFIRSLPASPDYEEGLGAISIRLQHTPTVGRMVQQTLEAIRYPFSSVTAATVGLKRGLLLEAFKEKGTRLVFIDEATRIAKGCGIRRADGRGHGTDCSELVREWIDKARLGVVLLGDTGLDEIETFDAALGSRVTAHVQLDNFKLDRNWLGYLHAFADNAKSIDLSAIKQDKLPAQIHAATGGNPRSLKQLLIEATLVTVDNGLSKVDAPSLKAAFMLVNGPSTRLTNPFGI